MPIENTYNRAPGHIDPAWLITRLDRAIQKKQPVTLTYRAMAKDKITGKRSSTETEITVRTVEPYTMELSNGHGLLKALDRDTGLPRSWRLDRIVAYTVHRQGKRMCQHFDTPDGNAYRDILGVRSSSRDV
jgi:predicted DNA-binding transcriptional regulator YafY